MSKRSKSGSGTESYYKLAMVLLVIIVGLFAVDYMGIYDVPFFSTGPKQIDPGPGPGPTRDTPCTYDTAIVTSAVAAWDSLDISTARTVGTNINVLWFRYSGGWIKLASGNAADLTLGKNDNNNVYLAAQFPSSPAHFVDYQKILAMNPHLSWYGYMDITGDDIEEFIFKVNVAGSTYASATGKWNMPLVNIYLLTYDSSFAIPSGGQPADVTAVGEATTTKYAKWYAEIATEKQAAAIYKVTLVANTTDISKVTLKKMNIPGIGYLDGSSFSQDVLSDQIKWTYTISNNVLYGCNLIERPVNSPNEHQFTTALEFNLATNDVIQMTLAIYQLTAGEASVSDTDSVIYSEAG
ncbi:hypothetical protein H8E65_03905 [Candidatus Bathyarchaeota archaeon]|nr:hypothetical protein [Candidatus Bathyarchaeota archaeon]